MGRTEIKLPGTLRLEYWQQTLVLTSFLCSCNFPKENKSISLFLSQKYIFNTHSLPFLCSLNIRVEFTRKTCKTAILFHTAGVLHIFMLYNLLGPETSFYRKSKIVVKRKPNYEIGWFHN